MPSVSIPGKVMLSGEYAVLQGAPSVLLPVPRWLRITAVEEGPADGYSPVVQAALEQPLPVTAEHEAHAGLPHIGIDSKEFLAGDSGRSAVKLGLGLSAAEAVGVIALRCECAGISWLTRWREVAAHAMVAHRRAQGGIGSGADVAACAYGRPLVFQRTEQGFSAADIAPPPAGAWLPLNLAWTGQPADTRSAVRHFDAWVHSDDPAADRLLPQLLGAAATLAEAWFGVGAEELLARVDEFVDVVRQCTAAAGIAYELPAHLRLATWAKRHGGRAKPVGAGGGDMVLLIGDLPLDQLGEVLLIPLEQQTLWRHWGSTEG